MKKLMMLCLPLFLLVGCSESSNVNDQTMQKAKEAIVEKQFEKAEGFVELVLENQPDDTEAKQYQKQLELYQKGLQEVQDKKYKEAKKTFESVIKIKDGSNKLVEYSKEQIKNLEKETTGQSQEKEKTEDSKTEETKSSTVESDAELTDTQLKEWVSAIIAEHINYNPALANIDLIIEDPMIQSTDGLKYVEVRVAQSDNYGTFRLNSNGQLEAIGNVVGSLTDWKVISESYMDTSLFKEQLESQDSSSDSEVTPELDAETQRYLDLLQGTYTEPGQSPSFAIKGNQFISYDQDKTYQITSIQAQELAHTQFTIGWDFDSYVEQYGSSAGSPQPFMFDLHVGIQGNGFSLVAPNGTAFVHSD